MAPNVQPLIHHARLYMPALYAGIHVLMIFARKTWMVGTSPAMTILCSTRQPCLYHAARLGHVHLPDELAAQHADDLAHVLHAGGAGFLHRHLDRRLHFII